MLKPQQKSEHIPSQVHYFFHSLFQKTLNMDTTCHYKELGKLLGLRQDWQERMTRLQQNNQHKLTDPKSKQAVKQFNKKVYM
jgi:hypothetical protein